MLLMSLYFVILHLTLLLWYTYTTNAQSFFHPVLNVSTTWINNPSSCPSQIFYDKSTVRLISYRQISSDIFYGFGFYCNGNCTSYQLSIIIYSDDLFLFFPYVIWSSNRNNHVGDNATLEFTQEGDLILRDVDSKFVWSTNTTNKSIAGLNVTDLGNLVLFSANNSIVWQSFDYPTDTLVIGQKLSEGQRLIACASPTNSTDGLFSLYVRAKSMVAVFESNPPLSYYACRVSEPQKRKEPSYMILVNGSFTLNIFNDEQNMPECAHLSLPLASSIQFLKLDSDGHLKAIEIERGQVADIYQMDACGYPLACGNYGICSRGQCTCPQLISNGISCFKPIDDRQPNLGCYETTPLSCEAPQDHLLLPLEHITHFQLVDGINSTSLKSCKEICLGNCSCKATFFLYRKSETNGKCFIKNDVNSLINDRRNNLDYKQLVFIKVQMMKNGIPNPTEPSSTALSQTHVAKVFVLIIAGLSSIFLTITSYVIWRRRVSDDCINYLDQLPGMPIRFSYKDLKKATKKFSKILGEGGFGSVYEGTLTDGTKVAVKRPYGLRNMKDSFLVEVETISSIHHVNLVRLLGFCVDASHQLLVYEYMCNGSLDKWIYIRNQNPTLDWPTRKRIILDIAKGLTYLHEECEQRIVHLDIKPQNILLDNKFNAKVSDFGLSKLINREQSKVMTTMRGTFGYLAPEWLSSVITEKVDVFSFGIVVIEILCGRKNLDYSQPEECVHLLSLLEKTAKEDRLHEMVDKICEDMQLPREEAVKIMKVANWCLQNEYSERPSMSMVVKVLEGAMDIEIDLAFKFSSALPPSTIVLASSPLLPAVLSGPR